jgi:hypothetical protein
MLSKNQFIKKYRQLHRHVSKKYASLKFCEALKFGIFSSDDDSSSIRTSTNRKKSIESIESDFDELYNVIPLKKIQKPSKTLKELLEENNINPFVFFKFFNNKRQIQKKDYPYLIQTFLRAVENGDASPIESLSPEQRGLLREHRKCKLYNWMTSIAPNVSNRFNIITDNQCRFFYMYEGLFVETTNTILLRLIHHLHWMSTVFDEVISFTDSETFELNLKSFLNNETYNYALQSSDSHLRIMFKHPDFFTNRIVYIVDPHGSHGPNINELSNLVPHDVDVKFNFYKRTFNEQGFEGSCGAHSLTRLIYVVHKMSKNYYTLENLKIYFNKKIPCPYAIFTQNLIFYKDNTRNVRNLLDKQQTLQKINKTEKRSQIKKYKKRIESIIRKYEDDVDNIEFHSKIDQYKYFLHNTQRENYSELLTQFKMFYDYFIQFDSDESSGSDES